MTFAQVVGSGSTGIIGTINVIIVPFLLTLSFFVFIYGVVDIYFLHPDDSKKLSEGKQFIFWGILGIAVLLSVWGLVNMLLSTLGLQPAG